MTIIHDDILHWAATYDGPKFHALLTDPPYHLTSIVERFGKPGAAAAQGDVYARSAKGFMGKDWDGGDIAFRPETWAAIAEHLHPGAWGMAFAGSRGWHRMACAIEGLVGVPIASLQNISDLLGLAIETRRWDLVELAKREIDGYLRLTGALVDAGLIIQPTIFGWAYGSGFPKATRIDTQIDALAFREWLKLHPVEAARLKAARLAERAARRANDRQATKDAKAELTALSVAYKALAGLTPAKLGTKKQTGAKFALTQQLIDNGGFNDPDRAAFDVLGCATEAAAYWLGHRYGGQCLKPAIEPIIVFQKPYAGSPLACMLATGAGALWIDGARIAGDVPQVTQGARDAIYGNGRGLRSEPMESNPHPAGRWPANFVLSHHPACNGTCAPHCPVAALGAQSGELTSGKPGIKREHGGEFFGDDSRPEGHQMQGIGDTGTAARFFYQADYMAERLELADAIAYVAKASRSEREAGLDPRQTALMRLLDDGEDAWDDDPYEGVYEDQKWVKTGRISKCPEHDVSYPTGSTHYRCGCARQFKSRDDFDHATIDDGRATPIDNPYQRGETTRRNIHPTIKPIALTRHLATLLLPPAQYGPRRLLIPFSGAGSEVIGADLAGWEDVTGVELGTDHVAIAEARRAYWQQRRWELGDPARKPTVKASAAVPQGQLDMFVDDYMDTQRKLHQEWMANPPTFEEWHAATGGLREEYDKLSRPPMTHEEWLQAIESEAA